MVGLKVRKKPTMSPVYKQFQIVKIRSEMGALSKGTLCRVNRCGATDAVVTPLVGSFAGEQINIGVELLCPTS